MQREMSRNHLLVQHEPFGRGLKDKTLQDVAD